MGSQVLGVNHRDGRPTCILIAHRHWYSPCTESVMGRAGRVHEWTDL